MLLNLGLPYIRMNITKSKSLNIQSRDAGIDQLLSDAKTDGNMLIGAVKQYFGRKTAVYKANSVQAKAAHKRAKEERAFEIKLAKADASEFIRRAKEAQRALRGCRATLSEEDYALEFNRQKNDLARHREVTYRGRLPEATVDMVNKLLVKIDSKASHKEVAEFLNQLLGQVALEDMGDQVAGGADLQTLGNVQEEMKKSAETPSQEKVADTLRTQAEEFPARSGVLSRFKSPVGKADRKANAKPVEKVVAQ